MKRPHLLLGYDEQVNFAESLAEFCSEIECETLSFQKEKLPSRGPQSSPEVFIFTCVVLFVLKSYFEGFLNEAGKHHYTVLRMALKKQWKHFFHKDRKLQAGIFTVHGEIKPKYSLIFSMYSEIDNGKKVKFLIRDHCSRDEFEEGIDAFLDLIEQYHSRISPKKLDIDLDSEKDYGGYIFIEFDTGTNSLRVLDPYSNMKDKN